MSYCQITSILAEHGILTREFHGCLQAEDIYTLRRNGRWLARRKWHVVTGMSRSEVYAWLGY